MTDRELLELAAKAAGIGDWVWDEQFLCMKIPPNAYVPAHTQKHWNPLTDDGDALRLAVKRGLLHDHYHKWKKEFDLLLACGLPPDKATRRAFVLVAAELGRAM